MRVPWAVRLVVLVALASGCVSPTGPQLAPPPDEASEAQSMPTAMVLLEGCDMSSTLTEIPEAWTDPMMPPGADGHELVPYMNMAAVQFWHCSRGIIGTEVREDVAIVEAYIGGTLEMSNETISGLLVLAMYVNDEVLQATMAGVGINATLAQVHPQMTAPLAGGPALRGWRIIGPDFSVSFDYASLERSQLTLTADATFWYLGPPHVRGEAKSKLAAGDAWEQDMVTMQFEGESRIKSMFGGMDAWPAIQQQYYDGEHTYMFTGGYT